MTKKQSVIITGAGAGIGKACVHKFAKEGYGVVACDIDGDLVNKVANEVAVAGFTCIAVDADVSSAGDMQRAVDLVIKQWGGVDALVANAGIQDGGSLLDTNPDHWKKILDVNLLGAALSCQAVIPDMKKKGNGAIALVSSVNALVATRGMTAYDMSKAGVIGLMRSLAVEFGRDGIRVNAICPGNTITDFHINNLAAKGLSVDDIRNAMKDYGALGRAAEPREIANAIYFLCSDAASFVTGHTLVADGGFSIQAGG